MASNSDQPPPSGVAKPHPEDRINVSEEIRALLRIMRPQDRQAVAAVLARLPNDQWRDSNKIDFGMDGEDQLWGVVYSMVNVTFVEEKNDTITVVHISARSRFRPTW